MTVGNIMTRDVVSCQKDTDVGAAAALMLKARVGSLPVIDTHGKLAGIITDRDIAIAAGTRRRNAAHIAVHEAMSGKVHSCFATDDVGAALKEMAEARVRRLPVLDANGHLAGIISMDDVVLRALDRAGGVSSSAFINALTRVCSQPSLEPEGSFSDTLISG